MKKNFPVAFLFALFVSFSLHAQNISLYVSKQNNQTLKFSGSYDKTTDNYENGHMTISTTGPIQYSVSPGDFSIGINESKSWNGDIWGDPAAAPAPGQSAEATMKGDYHIEYSRPAGSASNGTVLSTHYCKSCPVHPDSGLHEVVAEDLSKTYTFTVFSINVEAPDTVIMCTNATKVVAATGYPADGKYSWSASGAVTIDAGGDQDQVTLKGGETAGAGEATVTYAFGNVTYVKKVVVVVKDPEIVLPERIDASIGQQITITPRISPSGSVRWSVSNGLQLNSGPYNYVAFITCRQGGDQTATATITVCGRTITRNVLVKVNPCKVQAPDTVNVLKGNTVSITASSNLQGTYSWAGSGKISVQGGANTATVTVKGEDRGAGKAEVTFNAANCQDKKEVFVNVMDRPTVTITPQWSNTAFGANAEITICKAERRLFIANGLPAGGTYSWALTGPLRAYGVANNSVFVFEATGGGVGTVTVTYTKDGQTATASVTVNVTEVSRIEITASNNANAIPRGTAVTYTARVLNQAGQDITNRMTLHWKVVYIPVGQRPNVGNWVSYDLQGGGNTQTYTWSFPQGNNPLPGNPPYRMSAWIEAAEYCTYKSGSVHIEIVSNNRP